MMLRGMQRNMLGANVTLVTVGLTALSKSAPLGAMFLEAMVTQRAVTALGAVCVNTSLASANASKDTMETGASTRPSLADLTMFSCRARSTYWRHAVSREISGFSWGDCVSGTNMRAALG